MEFEKRGLTPLYAISWEPRKLSEDGAAPASHAMPLPRSGSVDGVWVPGPERGRRLKYTWFIQLLLRPRWAIKATNSTHAICLWVSLNVLRPYSPGKKPVAN